MTVSGEQIVSLDSYCHSVARQAKDAASQLALVSSQVKNDWLHRSAAALRAATASLLEANSLDVSNARTSALAPPLIDRLTLTAQRIAELARGLEEIAALPDPVGELLESSRRPNGLEVNKVRVPLGVVFFIYESRPNVTADAAAICIKSGNAVILRGGKEAAHSSQAIVACLQHEADQAGLPRNSLQLVSTADRDAVTQFLKLNDFIDVAIPRGGEALIRRVANEARMPVIKHYAGNCHVYVDRFSELPMATAIVVNSKCQRMGVCNACESLLVHEAVARQYLPQIATELLAHGVELRGDSATCALIPAAQPAAEQDYFTEFLGPIIAIKVVASLEAAIAHINHYGSHHTDAIVTANHDAARKFVAEVDSAAVIVNASTRFNDGGQFGLGAEIGISTDKFHARGPCGLKELTSYKYVCYGTGQIRE